MGVADAAMSDFPVLVLVLHVPDPARVANLSALLERCPRAAVVWVSDDPSVGEAPLPPHRLDLMLARIGGVLGINAALRRQLSPAVMAAIGLMRSHCGDPLTVHEIATCVGVSEDHLIRLFREAFGLPAATYYTRLRIAVACRLLRDTDDKVDDVAHQVGYSGAANLSRAFKDVMGIRPREFRRGHP
jgi:AraC-like DNA-binding protein